MAHEKRMLVFVAAVFAAAVSGMGEGTRRDVASTDVVKELFPWFEIGETIDADTVRKAKLRGRDDPAPREGVALRHLFSHQAREGFRAHEQYLIGGPRLLEILKVVDQDVCVQLSDAEFGKELNVWLKKLDR